MQSKLNLKNGWTGRSILTAMLSLGLLLPCDFTRGQEEVRQGARAGGKISSDFGGGRTGANTGAGRMGARAGGRLSSDFGGERRVLNVARESPNVRAYEVRRVGVTGPVAAANAPPGSVNVAEVRETVVEQRGATETAVLEEDRLNQPADGALDAETGVDAANPPDVAVDQPAAALGIDRFHFERINGGAEKMSHLERLYWERGQLPARGSRDPNNRRSRGTLVFTPPGDPSEREQHRNVVRRAADE